MKRAKCSHGVSVKKLCGSCLKDAWIYFKINHADKQDGVYSFIVLEPERLIGD